MNRPSECQEAEQLQRQYLDALWRRLWLLPATARQEIHRELASHIECLVTEARCQEVSPLEATRAALRQFGCPALIGRRFVWQWYQENGMKTSRFWGALGMVAISLSSIWLLLSGSMFVRIFFPTGGLFTIGPNGPLMGLKPGRIEGPSPTPPAPSVYDFVHLNSVAFTLVLVIPFLIVFGFALLGCVTMFRRQPTISTH